MANKKNNVEKVEVIHKDISELKSELLEYVENKIDTSVEITLKKSEKKLIRHKNIVIFKQLIFIIILLILNFILLYKLYQNHFFDKYINLANSSKQNESQVEKNDIEETSDAQNATETLINQYGNLLENIKLSDQSPYLDQLYSGTLTNELKLALAAENLNNETLINENGMTIILEKDLQKEYSDIFSKENYESVDFVYSGANFKFLKTQNMFIASENLQKESYSVEKIIVDIQKEEDDIKISTIECFVKNKKIYNIKSKKSIGNYVNSDSIMEYKEKLTKVNYYFKKEDEKKILYLVEVDN